jgi:hypothetical protein
MSAPGLPEDPLDHFSPEEAKLFVRFLILIRDNYRKADKAAHFLERKGGVAFTTSMANLGNNIVDNSIIRVVARRFV